MSGVSMVNGHIDEPKKACNECVHYELCKYNAHQRAIYLEKDKELYINIDNHIACKFFKDKVALEKQIPKKVTFHKSHYRCPSCNDLVIGGSFCKYCGQALDWSDTE